VRTTVPEKLIARVEEIDAKGSRKPSCRYPRYPRNLRSKVRALSLAANPPRLAPRRIVAKVEQLMALVDALEQQLAASRATGEKLLAALVAELTAA
jgi:hypothetical protein